MEGKFSAYSLEDGTLRGESTEPKTFWFGFYPIWSIEIHGNTDREMIGLRFENADGTWILNEKEVFRPDTIGQVARMALKLYTCVREGKR